jgi:3-hydroxyisobutyrate dehydrogenase-like beta-hydroxyacid dehydrogenase
MPQTPNPIRTLGFIGLGVMGEPMCGHLARRAGKPILAHDLRPEPLERLASNAVTAASLERIAAEADVILLSLPDGKAMASVVAALEPRLKAGQCVVDTSTSSVALTREIGARLTAKGILFADSPARGRRRRKVNFRSWSAPPTKPSPMSARSWRPWARMSRIADRSAAARW